MSVTKIKSYSELIRIPGFEDRLSCLMQNGTVGDFTFNGHRHLNQVLYQCVEWRRARREAIIRDSDGDYVLDLAHRDYPIAGSVFVHHINPITIDDILERRQIVFDTENLICCSKRTHQIIHYGNGEDVEAISNVFVERKPNDTCLWR